MYYMEKNGETLSKKTSHWNDFHSLTSSNKIQPPQAKTPHVFLDPLDVNPGAEDEVWQILLHLIDEASPN